MGLDRAFADNERLGDLGVGVSSGDKTEDLLFSARQGGEACEPLGRRRL